MQYRAAALKGPMTCRTRDDFLGHFIHLRDPMRPLLLLLVWDSDLRKALWRLKSNSCLLPNHSEGFPTPSSLDWGFSNPFKPRLRLSEALWDPKRSYEACIDSLGPFKSLAATEHNYMHSHWDNSLFRCVLASLSESVRPSVGRSVSNAFFFWFRKWKIELKKDRNL